MPILHEACEHSPSFFPRRNRNGDYADIEWCNRCGAIRYMHEPGQWTPWEMPSSRVRVAIGPREPETFDADGNPTG